MLLVAVVDQRVQPLDRLDDARRRPCRRRRRRAAELDELLAPEARRSRARRSPERMSTRAWSRNFIASGARARPVAKARHHRPARQPNGSRPRRHRRSRRGSAPWSRPALSWKTSAVSARQPCLRRPVHHAPRPPRWRSRCPRRPAPPSSRSRLAASPRGLSTISADQPVLVVGAGIERPDQLRRARRAASAR